MAGTLGWPAFLFVLMWFLSCSLQCYSQPSKNAVPPVVIWCGITIRISHLLGEFNSFFPLCSSVKVNKLYISKDSLGIFPVRVHLFFMRGAGSLKEQNWKVSFG